MSHRSTPPTSPGPPAGTTVAVALTAALAAVSSIAAALTFFADGLLTGSAVMQGCARGTALVVLLAGVPTLVAATALRARGAARAVFVVLGAQGYLLYNAVLFLFATPFNRIFLLYTAMLGLALWSLAATAAGVDRVQLTARSVVPVRPVAVWLWAVAGINAAVWLRTIVPALAAERPAAFLDRAGLTTNPVYVQDLALWLPLAAVAAGWLWRRRPHGFLVAGALLCMQVLESVSVAADQWFGSRAEPGTPWASSSMVVPFLVLAVAGLVPAATFLRSRPAPARPARAAGAGERAEV